MSEISKTADLALRALIVLGESGPATAASLGRELGVNRTVVHRILTTLQSRGFVVRRDRTYALGGTLRHLAASAAPDLRALARPTMARLVETARETVVMHAPEGNVAVVVEQVVADHHVLRVEHPPGSRHPLHRGASGRAMLAFMDDQTIDTTLREEPDAEKTRVRLREVRDLGYALSFDELQHGVHGAAAPVLDPNGSVVASVAILVPATRTASMTAHLDDLLAAAGEMGAALHAASQPARLADRARDVPDTADTSDLSDLSDSVVAPPPRRP
ncbi:IclR family transcriptional regulator [Actinomadura macra]|uniref:IclR family transcriptional regulator n=1 Tax=Actinomadura macra TaxID=46164 RepID=UPI000835B663|nr:IclR family transcriptional regulator C-terminal domain-containing protein [Actinomadura macra]